VLNVICAFTKKGSNSNPVITTIFFIINAPNLD